MSNKYPTLLKRLLHCSSFHLPSLELVAFARFPRSISHDIRLFFTAEVAQVVLYRRCRGHVNLTSNGPMNIVVLSKW